MKSRKEAILIIFLIIPLISSIEITFSKENYQPQETLQAVITGNFISLTNNNIFLYKNGKSHPEPVIKDLTKQNNIYYFYAVLPKNPGNYTFKIQDIEYLERGYIKNLPITKDLTIIIKNQSDLSFNPGFIVPLSDFSIKLKSLYGNTNLTAIFEATGETKELSLIEQREETINFHLPSLFPQKSKIILNNYEIPVFLIKKINITEEEKLEFIPYKLDGILSTKNYFFSILIKNIGNVPLTNIKILSDIKTEINPSIIPLLEPSKTAIINLTISISEIGQLSGKLIAEASNKSFFLPIFFNVTKNETEVKINDAINSQQTLSCSKIGNLCKENEICKGDVIASLEGACCIGSCSIEEKSNYSQIIGIVLLVFLIIIIAYIILKIKKRKLKSPEEILKEKSERFKNRMEGEEVAGKLDRI